MADVATIQMDTGKASQYLMTLKKAPDIARDEMQSSLLDALGLLEREIKEDTPKGVGGAAGLRGSITHRLIGNAAVNGLRGEVFSPLAHARPVEFGTKPHPVSAEGRKSIKDWLEKIRNVDPSESASVAFLVARKIAREGTEGKHMFTENLSEHSLQVLNILSAGVDRIIARLNGGGHV